jgi:protein-tyrosine phosphatase
MLDFSEIIPDRLWVGSYVSEEDMPRLRRIGITAVVSLQVNEDLQHYGISPGGLARAFEGAGIEWRRVPTPDFDREALARNLPQAVAQVEEALADPHARLYLHCTVGVNRSPTTAAGFLIRARGFSAQEAYDYLTSRRDCSPSLDILEEYEAACRSALSTEDSLCKQPGKSAAKGEHEP